MRAGLMMCGVVVALTLSSAQAHAQEQTGGDEFASDGGAAARWWNQKAEQYPKCSGPAKQGAALTGQIWEEAYKKPEDVEKVHELGAQREGVKRDLQMCIATNYQVRPPLQGGIKQDDPADPDANGPYDGGTTGTGSGGNGKPSSGKGGSGKPGTGKTPPPKKQPPLSGGTQKGGGSGKYPGWRPSRAPMPGHANTGDHGATPPVWVGNVTILWSTFEGTQPVRAHQTVKIEIWDPADPVVEVRDEDPLKPGAFTYLEGRFDPRGSFTLTDAAWKGARQTKFSNLKFSPSQNVRLSRGR